VKVYYAPRFPSLVTRTWYYDAVNVEFNAEEGMQ